MKTITIHSDPLVATDVLDWMHAVGHAQFRAYLRENEVLADEAHLAAMVDNDTSQIVLTIHENAAATTTVPLAGGSRSSDTPRSTTTFTVVQEWNDDRDQAPSVWFYRVAHDVALTRSQVYDRFVAAVAAFRAQAGAAPVYSTVLGACGYGWTVVDIVESCLPAFVPLLTQQGLTWKGVAHDGGTIDNDSNLGFAAANPTAVPHVRITYTLPAIIGDTTTSILDDAYVAQFLVETLGPERAFAIMTGSPAQHILSYSLDALWTADGDAWEEPDTCSACGSTQEVASTFCGSFCTACCSTHIAACAICSEDDDKA